MSNDHNAVDIEELDAQTLSEMLGFAVDSVEITKVGTGQTGASYRLRLVSEQGPATLLAKVAAGDLEARARVKGGYAAEVGFYDQLVKRVDVRTPACWYAAISDDHLHFTLLLEDLAPRVAGVQAQGCSLPRAQAAICNLAALHAPLWNDPSVPQQGFLMNASHPQAAAFLGGMTVSAAAKYAEQFADALGADDVATLQQAAARVGDWLAMPQPRITVLHGDYRLDNLMFGEAEDDIYVLDWQTAGVGPGARDLAYFLGTCLEPAQRRQSERELVELYHQQLLARGVEDYTLEQCFEDYRLGHLQATMITTIGWVNATGEQSAESDGMFLAMAKRSCAAIRDLDTLSLVSTADMD